MRIDNRSYDQLRDIEIKTGVMPYAEGSAFIAMGNTKVICTATVESGVPSFLLGSGQGWLTAEYAMLPRATKTRNKRATAANKVDGRSTEIQRLIGRSLRACLDLKLLGEYTITIDCDVICADGGTRTAAISASYVALVGAIRKMLNSDFIKVNPIVGTVAAVSVGIVDGEMLLDLCYEEDSRAEVDMNVVMLNDDSLIELQGTAEHKSFSRSQADLMIDLAQQGIAKIHDAQNAALLD